MNEPAGDSAWGSANLGMSKIELGIYAAKELCQRMNGEVIDYDADETRTCIRIRIPSRAERFRLTVERSRQLVGESIGLHLACQKAVGRAYELGRINLAQGGSGVTKRHGALNDPTAGG